MGILFKVLIFVAGFMVFTFWLRGLLMSTRRDEVPHQEQRRVPRSRKAKQTITSCNHCGVFVPESQVVQGRFGEYCSKEHRDLEER